jgi:ferrous iron transport protein B
MRLLVFGVNLLCALALRPIGAIRREMTTQVTWFAIGYQTVFAYALPCAYISASLFSGGGFEPARGGAGCRSGVY